uniref:Uncharacterized protein n=1 Tax=Parascaris equorum TaxID=6256 RepID=A0A914R707_PAREQ
MRCFNFVVCFGVLSLFLLVFVSTYGTDENLEHEIDRKQRAVDESIVLAHSYLMQHDLRPRMHTPSALAEQPQDDTNAELRRVGIQIKSDSDKLAKKWSELKKQVNAWSRIIDDAHAKMEHLKELGKKLFDDESCDANPCFLCDLDIW